MFFIASKIAGFFLFPSNLIALAGLLGCVLAVTRWRRLATRLMAGSIVALLIAGFSPLGDVLMLTLSERFPAPSPETLNPAGIVILGGAISPEVSAARNMPELTASAERMTIVGELARRYPNARILFSGGNGNLIANGLDEARVALRLFEGFGIARERIELDDQSRNTLENAALSLKIARPKPGEQWLLVTSAYHMPRAVIAFRAAGFAVTPFPVDWRTEGWGAATTPFARVSSGLSRLDTAVHEWQGLIGYRVSGKSKTLLPAR